MERLFEFSHRKLQETPTDFIRYKYDTIKWQGRAFGLVGPRGVGKTTMLLQFIKKNLTEQNTLYVSTDHLYFSNHSLVELADRFVKTPPSASKTARKSNSAVFSEAAR